MLWDMGFLQYPRVLESLVSAKSQAQGHVRSCTHLCFWANLVLHWVGGWDWVGSLWSKAALIPKEETHFPCLGNSFLLLQAATGKEEEEVLKLDLVHQGTRLCWSRCWHTGWMWLWLGLQQVGRIHLRNRKDPTEPWQGRTGKLCLAQQY